MLIDYHRRHAAETIAQVKTAVPVSGPRRLNVTGARRALVEFRRHSKDLRAELKSMMEELDAADAWVEREYTRLVEPIVSEKSDGE